MESAVAPYYSDVRAPGRHIDIYFKNELAISRIGAILLLNDWVTLTAGRGRAQTPEYTFTFTAEVYPSGDPDPIRCASSRPQASHSTNHKIPFKTVNSSPYSRNPV